MLMCLHLFSLDAYKCLYLVSFVILKLLRLPIFPLSTIAFIAFDRYYEFLIIVFPFSRIANVTARQM